MSSLPDSEQCGITSLVFNLAYWCSCKIVSVPMIVFVSLNWLPLLNPHSDAPAESQADVLLGTVSQFRRPQDVLPRHQVQQE